MVYLDLDELADVFRGRWLWSVTRPAWSWFRRADHLGDPRRPLDACVRDLVEQHSGRRPLGPVRLLTNLRTAGYLMNPVSFYYCFGPDGEGVEAVVAEVTNTPWGERHCYVVEGRGGAIRRETPKEFHVSPFMGMDLVYHWTLREPGRHLGLRIANRERDGTLLFDAVLALERREISGRSLARALLRYPLMTGRVATAIYGQALRLAWKRAPFFPHPGGVSMEVTS